MTDISCHFNGIIKILLKSHLHYLHDEMRRELRAFLPESYDTSKSYLPIFYNESRTYQKKYLSPIIDAPRRNSRTLATNDKRIHIDDVLLIPIVGATVHMPWWVEDYFQRTKAIKSLKVHPKQSQIQYPKLPPVGQRRQKFPKYRLPIVVWVFEKVGEWIPPKTASERGSKIYYTRDEYIEFLIKELDKVSVSLRPDFIYATGYDLLYRNPLLEQRPLTGYDIGLSKIEPLRKPRRCVDCGEKYLREHFFYEDRCVRCGDIAYRQRQQ